MDWRDKGFVLAARRHGETALIVELLTAEHGRHAGLVRGGQSPRRRAVLQLGNLIESGWRGRLVEHLGTFDCELVEAYAARLIDDPDRLCALTAATALLSMVLPEREPQPDVYALFAGLVAELAPASAAAPSKGLCANDSVSGWAEPYVVWECELLAALGFGLDLSRCAATGQTENLVYVSPRSGRAVSREAGQAYRDKLLPLPGFLLGEEPVTPAGIAAGIELTGHFLLHHVLAPHGARLPEMRDRLAERMRRHAGVDMIGR